MKTQEIKNQAKEALKEIEININANKKLSSIINDYIEFVEKNVPSEFYNSFGIGIAGSHSQFGTHYGFEDQLENGYLNGIGYCTTGSGYFIANDFNAEVNGSDFNQMLAFAKKIPFFINQGFLHLKNANEEVDKITKELKELNF